MLVCIDEHSTNEPGRIVLDNVKMAVGSNPDRNESSSKKSLQPCDLFPGGNNSDFKNFEVGDFLF